MSRDHAKKEMVTGDKLATSHGKAPSGESDNKKREESPPRVKSHRSGDKKKMKKVVYYETNSLSPSTSGSDTPSITSKHHERKKFSKIPLRYPRISKHTPLLSVPLGKPPVFDGEDYCMWSDKMRHHLTVGVKAKTLPFALAFINLTAPSEEKRPTGSTLRPLHYKTKAYDDVAPSHVLTRLGGPRGIRPIVTGPARRSVLRARFVMAFL
jgi:hypothetical protein